MEPCTCDRCVVDPVLRIDLDDVAIYVNSTPPTDPRGGPTPELYYSGAPRYACYCQSCGGSLPLTDEHKQRLDSLTNRIDPSLTCSRTFYVAEA